MAQDNRTDPLARYTGTGSRTSQPKPSTKASWWEKIVTPVATVAAAPFSRSAAQDVGSFVGGAISNVPGLRNVVGSNVGGAVASAAPALYGTSYLQNAVESAQAGDYAKAAKDYGMFGANLYLTGKVGGPASRAGVSAARTGGIGAFLPTTLAAARKYTVPQALGAAANIGAGALQVEDILSGQALAREAQRGVSPSLPADRAAEMASRTQANAALGYLRTPQYTTSQYGSTIKQNFTDAEGRVHTWNPRSKMYEVTGTVAPGAKSTAPVLGLSAAQQLEFENRLRDIEAETQAVLSGLGGQASAARSEAKAGREESRRQVAGSAQDLASGLAFLGLDTSPGVLDVGQEYQAREGAQREAAIAKSLAETISGISSRSAEAKRRAKANREQLAAARLAAEEENIREQQKNSVLNILFGGK